MTIYRQLQDEILKWDQAVDEQGEQLVAAATQLAAHLPKYLGIEEPGAVRLGVGAGDEFNPRGLETDDCEPDGVGELNFTVRLRILPTGNPDYEWQYSVQIRLSIDANRFTFNTLNLLGHTKYSASITLGEAQTGAFAPVYEAIVRTVKDDFDSRSVKRVS
ncbi:MULTISPECIES: hypothetical protein [unclassified Pseudomonas]|uniref:hypothetical protein n=1 Tax=unclassified Pseudomonas TaxID=196821 RepID=UPI000A1DB577|nr:MULTISPECIES: hypothetical protein [unclassified Pseudomonas]